MIAERRTDQHDLTQPNGRVLPRLYDSIVVPLDGSDLGERALPHAEALAVRWGIPIDLLSVVAEPVECATAERYLEKVAASTRADVRVIEPVIAGTPADGIRRAIAKLGHALPCVSTHGHGGAARAIFGSVAEAVLREIAGPVLLIGPHAQIQTPARQETLLASVDGSSLSEEILRVATDWAEALQMQLCLVNVVAPKLQEEIRGLDIFEDRYVASLARRLDGVRVPVVCDVLHGGNAADAIVAYAHDLAASLIAMATHGQSGFARLTAGSTTMGVIHAAHCPVLTLRPSKLGRG